jgi:cellulose biosynthesis protein BcsQ
MVDARKRMHREVMQRLREQSASVLETAIPASAEIERMGIEREVLAAFAPRGRAAGAYESLWHDVKRRLE